MTSSTREATLEALGHVLDQHAVGNVFISLNPEGVDVTPFQAARPGVPFRFDLAHLHHLATTPRSAIAAATPWENRLTRADLLALAGRELDRQRCHRAFIVVYDDLLIVNLDGYGAGEMVIYSTGDGVTSDWTTPTARLTHIY